MPRTKRFESLKLTISFEIQYLDMFEVSEHFYKHIQTVLKYIDNGDIVCIEVPEEEKLYKIKKEGNKILLRTNTLIQAEEISREFNLSDTQEAMNFLNWLFAKAPFISAVGTSQGF